MGSHLGSSRRGAQIILELRYIPYQERPHSSNLHSIDIEEKEVAYEVLRNIGSVDCNKFFILYKGTRIQNMKLFKPRFGKES